MTDDAERAAKLKELRKEIEEKLEEQLPPEITSEKNKMEVQKIDDSQLQDPAMAKRVIEALLFASAKPMTVNELRRVVKILKPSEIEAIILEIKNEYAEAGRSFELREIAGGYEIGTRKEFAPWILRLEIQKKAKQATQSALETLAILAYKQPITRAEIEELRGVDVSGVITTLVSRGLIKIVGKKEVPGRPFLYGTTDKFLEHFGLRALTDLPNIEEIKNLVENSVKKEELLGTAGTVVQVTEEQREETEHHESEPAAQEN